MLLPGKTNESEKDVHIGRVLTTAAFRGFKLGNAMLERALTQIVAQWPDDPISLHAQAHLQKFYGAFGFVPSSDIHDEDGILPRLEAAEGIGVSDCASPILRHDSDVRGRSRRAGAHRSERSRDRTDSRSQWRSAINVPMTLIIEPGIHSSRPPIC